MATPSALPLSLFQHRYLIGQLVRRDVLLKFKYRGHYLGIGRSFLYPLLHLSFFLKGKEAFADVL
jgi:ABC-type polysaccharide/polyol phosphate export permease